jgi:hypothetical protein
MDEIGTDPAKFDKILLVEKTEKQTSKQFCQTKPFLQKEIIFMMQLPRLLLMLGQALRAVKFH